MLHRLLDLRAAGDEGTRQQRRTEGLLAEASTVVVYRQHPGEIPTTTELLGLSSTEAEVIGGLGDGQALWRGGRSFLVQHVLSDIEWALVDTDAEMLEPDRDVLDRQAADETDQARTERPATDQRRAPASFSFWSAAWSLAGRCWRGWPA